MKLKITLPLLALCVTVTAFGQKSKFLTGETGNPIRQLQIEDVKIKSTDTSYIYSATPQSPVEIHERNNAPQHFPYPIIFIHGLVGSADTWTEFYNYALNQGWSYGGHIRFNLNSDENFEFSNIYSASQIDIEDFNGNLPAADFYLLNFNCALDGTSYGGNYNTTTQSNQAAIAKQGLALRNAIQHVLNATGKDKVILFGHSMGGLAARQYLQNTNFWQQDGNHHVAKLITSGTPHGGSNQTGTFILDAFLDLDERSDAVRDLRRTYYYSGNQGVFLYGGSETSTVINDNLFGFYDLDVNCNGSEGNQVTGLNQKNIYTDLDYSCIIGDWFNTGLNNPGDGVVEVEDAQLKNFYNINSETFTITSNHLPIPLSYTLHTELPEFTDYNFYGLDEPDYYKLSYEIEKNVDYNGFITPQASDAEYTIDYDDFTFTTTQLGWVSVFADNVVTYPFGISILGHPNYNYLFDQTYSINPIHTQAIQLPPGKYYLEFYATSNSTSWQYPYKYRLDWSPTNPTATNEANENIKINIAPNPVVDYANIKIESQKNINGYIKLQNGIGQVVYEDKVRGTLIDKQIDMGRLPEGMYFVTIGSENELKTMKIMKKR